MAFEFRHLEERTRALMLEEIQSDIDEDRLYLSDNLSPDGRTQYSGALLQAASEGDELDLTARLTSMLNSHEKPRKLKGGGFSKPPVMRANAHEMLAEGEFNRFYMRAVCRLAIENGDSEVTVYRAKQVDKPRSASETMIGQRVPANQLLADLRDDPRVDRALGLPPGPNSGLCVHLCQ